MFHLCRKIWQVFPDWNERVHTVAELEGYCEKNDIVTLDTPNIDDLGEYRVRDNTPVILINKFVSGRYRNWVLAHEIGHDLFHTPASCKFSTGTKYKIEKEANIFAACYFIPQRMIATAHPAEIEAEYGYPRRLIQLRAKLYLDNNKF